MLKIFTAATKEDLEKCFNSWIENEGPLEVLQLSYDVFEDLSTQSLVFSVAVHYLKIVFDES